MLLKNITQMALNGIVSNFTYVVFAGILLIVLANIRRRNEQHQLAKKLIAKAVQSGLHEPHTLHPQIDEKLCSGCGACTSVCPEGDILKLINHKAVLVGPTKCVGHGECERACPVDAIKLVFGTKTKGMDIPRLTTNYETNVSGLYIAGELGGMGLIRNAIKQGILAGQHALFNLKSAGIFKSKADFDLIVVGAGPAGIAASMTAIANKKSYLCIDQNTLGGAVYNYPRQKIVMSYPFELPMVGQKSFQSNKVSKEELLHYWMNVSKSVGLKIKEKIKFNSLEKDGNIFKVITDKGTFTAKKVILCMGLRGTPRQLNVPGEDTKKVTYNLIDPEQYKNKRIIVVGGGNAGVEAAQMLADSRWNNKVHLLVRSANFDRCNEDNIKRINTMKRNGLVEIWFNSTVQSIEEKDVKIKKSEENVSLANDYVFIFAGAEMPHQFLMSLGIKTDKKFGESLAS